MTADLTFNSTNAATPQTVTITILDDLLLEDSEVFNVTLTTNNSNITFLPDLATVTIEDVESKLKEEINHTVVGCSWLRTLGCSSMNLHFGYDFVITLTCHSSSSLC